MYVCVYMYMYIHTYKTTTSNNKLSEVKKGPGGKPVTLIFEDDAYSIVCDMIQYDMI